MAFFPDQSQTQLTPIFSQDMVTPGIFYFALLEPQDPKNVTSWWIVLRCPQEILPQPFKDSKNASSRAYPFFVPARNKFVWIERQHLYLLHDSQKSAFAQTLLHNEFSDFYDLAVGVAKPDPLKYFERDIQEASNQFLATRTRFANRPRGGRVRSPSPARRSSDYNPFFEENEDSDNAETDIVQHSTQRKRKRIFPTSASTGSMSSQPILGNSLLKPIVKDHITSSPQISKNSTLPVNQRPVLPFRHHHHSDQPSTTRAQSSSTPFVDLESSVYIKTEEEQYQMNYGKMANREEAVQVFVGPKSKPFITTRTAIGKSPILLSQIQEDPKFGRFIMHPSLASADKLDTLAMLQFMQDGEYSPKSVRRPDSSGNSPNVLVGRTYRYEYNDEVIRAGKLYNLAKTFQVQGFIQHILEKLKNTEYYPYSNMAVMQCAILIFQEPGNNGRATRDGVEAWLIKVISERFKDIMKAEAEQNLFWEMEQRTARRRVIRDIFALCAENYHNIGGIPIVIQDE